MLDDLANMPSLDPVSTDEPSAVRSAPPRVALSHGLQIRPLPDLDLMLVTKPTPGFTAPQVEMLHGLVRDIASGRVGPFKFLVFDLAAEGTAADDRSPGLAAFVEDLSNLIFDVPVVSVAWVRKAVSGADLELALACSMLVGEAGSRLAFDLDLVDSLRTYALLAHRLGFVRAERLMEGNAIVDAEAAHDLMILHSVVPASEGLDGIRRFVSSRLRRHNSACGLYRAQRISMLGAA